MNTPALKYRNAKRVCSCGTHGEAYAEAYERVAEGNCILWERAIAEYAEFLSFTMGARLAMEHGMPAGLARSAVMDGLNAVEQDVIDEMTDAAAKDMSKDMAGLFRRWSAEPEPKPEPEVQRAMDKRASRDDLDADEAAGDMALIMEAERIVAKIKRKSSDEGVIAVVEMLRRSRAFGE